MSDDSDPDDDDLTVSKVNDEPIDSDGVSTITLPSGAVVTIKTDGDYTYDPNDKFESLWIVATRALIPSRTPSRTARVALTWRR